MSDTFLMAEIHALENELEVMTLKAAGWQNQAELNARLLVECREKAERYRLEANAMMAQRAVARAALQSVMDWNPKPEYWERPDTVARFEADMARAREVLEQTEETKPHQKWWEVLEETEETKPYHWEGRALTAERERDEALNVLREINDWINLAAMRPRSAITANEAADAINAWGDKIRPILEVTE